MHTGSTVSVSNPNPLRPARDPRERLRLTTAARRVRAIGNKHSTMLIHTSVNTVIHNSFREPLQNLLEGIGDLLHAEDADLHLELESLWESECARVPASAFGRKIVSYAALRESLEDVARDCRVILDNASSKVRLDYENGPVVAIAVGGNTLSRGLTLEGLSVSYFVRSVSAYDTLLQMGRWFGYRTGYEDLPRVWLTKELREWFRHLATVEHEIRQDIDVYMTEDKTPRTFAVRMRTHPTLRVTAAAKMKVFTHAASSYGGQRIQTRYFDLSRDVLLENQRVFKSLISDVVESDAKPDHSASGNRFLWRGVSYESVVEFLDSYSFHEASTQCDSRLLTEYIQKRVANRALHTWNVAIVGKVASNDSAATFEVVPGVRAGCVVRSRLTDSDPVDIKTLMSRRDAAIDLDTSGVEGELTEGKIVQLRKQQSPATGLLVLYVIDKDSQPKTTSAPEERPKDGSESPGDLRSALEAPEHVIGVGLVFPEPIGSDSEVEWDYISADLSRIQIEESDLDEQELVEF
ncbi:Z1 domain-containing protein [Rhodococcus rhodochrous J45]|uniref:Z1 domain-containing protein n=1 Tax=Rhodococcus rhodochrous J45 TaxID=935266 RepID=A0A562E4G3_RHORH|nr:Z1 domain-containing protein [Rhodococcus rhodochrous]TWH16657.1 Z1 domain-containing protein [Rhodococcus rhodochrous J45]